MSELIYVLGEIDNRVRPLILLIRLWAKAVGITNSNPGEKISNFGLTSLVIYFLQQLEHPILPPVGHLENNPHFKSKNASSLAEVLLQFFEFYGKFDFEQHALSLNSVGLLDKPRRSAIYVINPIDGYRNITKVVTKKQCKIIQHEMMQAHSTLVEELKGYEANSQSHRGILALVGEKN